MPHPFEPALHRPVTRPDVAILGAGPVGSTLALLLVEGGLAPDAIVLIDRHARERAFADTRPIALSAGSLDLLGRFVDIDTLAHAPIRTVHVSQRGLFGRTLIEAREHGLARLGAVVRYGALMRALDAAVAASGLAPRYGVEDDDLRGNGPAARVAVHAEGRVPGAAEPAADAAASPWAQDAIVCEVSASRSRPGHAFERFTSHGPVALLPLPEPDRHAVIWCDAPGPAQRIAALDDETFCDRLQQRFGDRLGRFFAPGPRAVVPIASARSTGDDDPASVRIGNAAQTLHPVAGQGLNLGLRDAALLADALLQCRFDGPQGEPRTLTEALARFRRRRELDRAGTVALTDLLAHGFAGGRSPWLAPLAAPARLGGAVALALFDLVPPLRRRLARHLIYGSRD